MTGTRDPQQDGSIQAMLSDSGLETAAELRSALEQLRAVVPDAAPAPSADLAALLATGAAVSAAPVSATTTALPTVASANDADDESLPAGVTSLAERRGRKRRLAIVGGAVVGAMTLGAGAVAASSEDFRHSISQSVDVVFQPAGHGTPAPEHVQPSPSSVPALPAPAATGPSGTPGTAPSAPTGSAPAKQTRHTPPATPPAVGRDGILPTPPHRPVTPGVPALPGRGGERGLPSDPLPAPTLPGVLPTVPGQP
ncbi:hypothetical protein SAMN04487916_105262 [Arthrobacter sp. ov407]|uniref:hypothetical protein n=1 Tax=Arthrobacter sp. ov407 TaxID=1761748 RepID=UPI0008898C4B|nr:hypothetical protein [Arthrobacter sp. ov407]SDL08078.1 hypothetical protein SAMN04487916_105262 [Arthrobacter sp. ov407]